MDLAFVLQVAAVMLALAGASLWFIGAELRWQTRRREEQHRELLLALFRISKGQIRALDERARRGDELSSALLHALRRGEPQEVRAVLPEAPPGKEEAPPPFSDPDK
jgi:hypothetical protein